MEGKPSAMNSENHWNNISPYFLSCFNDGRFCDVVIKVSGDVFKAHKIVICAASNFFEAFFRMHGDADTIELQMEFKPHLFGKLLAFCYTGKINLQNDENLLEIGEMANFLGMLGLLKSIQNDLSLLITRKNVLQFMLFSDKHCLNLLWQDSCKIFSKYFNEILDDKEEKLFYDLPLDLFKRFLNDDGLRITNGKNKHASKYTFDSLESEKVILRSVMKYCNIHINDHLPKDNANELLELLHFVKLAEFQPRYLLQKLKSRKNLAYNDKVRSLFKSAASYRFKETDEVPQFWKRPRND